MPVPNPLYANKAQLKRYSGKPGIKVSSEPGRSAFRKDFARLLHAPSFRRLQGKTQLFPGVESDFFRNRLTHSLEVAQIAKGIASRLNSSQIPKAFPGGSVDEDLVEFAAIAHDLGHPPFGHNGEHALDDLMKEYGGFEGNAQTLRILAAVERKLVQLDGGSPAANFGLDLTYRSLAAVLKYDKEIPLRDEAAELVKGYYSTEAKLVSQIKRRVAPGFKSDVPFKTIECAIMDIADDIAYSTYDLEDSLHAGFVTPISLVSSIVSDVSVQKEVFEKTNKALTKAGHSPITLRRELVDVLIDVFQIQTPPTLDRILKPVKGKKKKAPIGAHDVLLIGLETWLGNQKLATDSLTRTQFTAERVGRLIAAVDFVPNNAFPQLSGVRMKREEMLQVEVLKHLNFELVIRSPRLAVVENRGKDLIKKIFTTLADKDGALLPEGWRERHAAALLIGKAEALRVVCDFVACMTDRYAAELHARLFGEGTSIFKPL